MKKRWLSLSVENDVGTLARVSSLLSAKSYNLDSLTVGPSEDKTISRMTIGLTSDDQTFEQIKKQLNRTVEVIKVVDLTNLPVRRRELMYITVHDCSPEDRAELFHISNVYNIPIIDYNTSAALFECLKEETENDGLIRLFSQIFKNRFEVIRGGSVAVERILF